MLERTLGEPEWGFAVIDFSGVCSAKASTVTGVWLGSLAGSLVERRNGRPVWIIGA